MSQVKVNFLLNQRYKCLYKFYETEEERRQFIRESFQLVANKILNAVAKLKEAVIHFFLTILKF